MDTIERGSVTGSRCGSCVRNFILSTEETCLPGWKNIDNVVNVCNSWLMPPWMTELGVLVSGIKNDAALSLNQGQRNLVEPERALSMSKDSRPLAPMVL